MSIKDVERRHLRLIGLYSTRYAIRAGAGLIFLLLVLIAGLLIANMVVSNTVDTVERETLKRGGTKEEAKEIFDMVVKEAEPYVSWFIGEREDLSAGKELESRDKWAQFLLRDRPALLSVMLLILILVTPGLCVLASFNQYSGDVSTRGIRYQLLRTERANIYFGRYLGTVIFASLVMGLLLFTIVIYLGLALDHYSWGALISWGLRGWLALTILIIPYVALSGWISGAIDAPFGSLVLCLLAIVGPPIAASMMKSKFAHASYINWLLPWGARNHLLHYSFTTVMLSILACLGYTAVFLGLGYRHFAKRDL